MSDDSPPTLADVEAAAVRLLSRRDHARGELANKLKKRELPADLIDEVLDDLEDQRILDDHRFCRQQAAILVRKGWGPRQIANKFHQRGVDREVVNAELATLDESEDWRGHAEERLRARFGAPDDLDQRDRERAFRHLRYRGFPPHLIRSLLFD